ncbi:MAG: hypothetical protein WBE18_03065 [Gammaproteobacteria bacterium]
MPIDPEILRRLNTNDPGLILLDLSKRNLTDIDVVKIVNALKNNTKVTMLNLIWNSIGPEGAKALAEALQTNFLLTSLKFGGNQMGDEGMQVLAQVLETNMTVTELDLADNQIGDKGAQTLAKSLKFNRKLTALNLAWNLIGDEGVEALMQALQCNTKLTRLDLTYNNITDKGARFIEEALKTNTTLIKLNLQWNPIENNDTEQKNLKEVAQFLKRNKENSSHKFCTKIFFDKKQYLLDLKAEVVKSEWNKKGKKIGSWTKPPDGIERLREVLKNLMNDSDNKDVEHCFSEVFKIIEKKYRTYFKNDDSKKSVTEQAMFYKKVFEEMQEISCQKPILPLTNAEVEKMTKESDEMFLL